MSENLILVSVDSLRADHCGFLGSEHDLTPTLDRLASEGVVFERAFAPGPRTPSSMPVVFSGEFVQPRNLGVYRSYDEKSAAYVERRARIRRHLDRFRSIPERMRELGYDTAGVTANPWTVPDTNFDRGFDVFHAVQDWEVEPGSLPLAHTAAKAVESGTTDWLLTWPDFYDLVVESRKRLDEPYFLWVFLLDPHQPYLTPARIREENTGLEMYYSNVRHSRYHSYTDPLPGHLETRLRRAYRDTVRSVDAFLDRLLSDFSEDDPATIVHADHGESFHEHGTYGHRPQLYRENLHVPFVVHGAEATGRVADPVTLRDMPDCVTRLARDDAALDPTALTRPFVLSRTEEAERTAVRNDEWVYVDADETYAEYLHDFQPEELYRFATDPDETRNLVGEHTDAAALMRGVLDRFDAHSRECGLVSDAAEAVAEEG